ncbi:hypothetical protein KSC_056640 [Ktedonobacter sp. SOSP1-52]|nr:hypothetical protein KSC_056640 [Ktedonobacter sp. SOSP1-52]
MARARKDIYFAEKQVERLERKSREENLPEAEIVRCAVDSFLPWDDPTYQPLLPNPPKTRKSDSSPP